MDEPFAFQARMPGIDVPAGACDCHMHIIGARQRYPMLPDRVYTPMSAAVADARRMSATLGTERLVMVQPSFYGTDNRCMLDAMAAWGPSCRGIAVLDADVADETLDRLHAAGIRGVRLNTASGGGRDAGALARAAEVVAKRVARLGWHVQFFIDADLLAPLAPVLAGLPVESVIDHMGHIPAAAWETHPGTRALCDLLAAGRTWVKLSGVYRLGAPLGPWDDVAPLARALHAARPERAVWASDWPHTQNGSDPRTPTPYRPVDTGSIMDLLADWVPDAAARRRVLVDNPARLYGF